MKICKYKTCDSVVKALGLCKKHYHQTHYKNNREHFLKLGREWLLKNKEKRHRYLFEHRNTITYDYYLLTLKKQKGLCAICKKKKKLCVDHDHKTGKFRGLLCHLCNAGIGMLGDNFQSFKRAIIYLRRTMGESWT